jgi:O-antigen/teichoic acid export membrane protein
MADIAGPASTTASWGRKSVWSLLGRLSAAGLSFVVNLLLVRCMSKADVGFFFWSLSICSGAACVSQWGSTFLAVKWIATARAHDDSRGVASAVRSLLAFTFMHFWLLLPLLFFSGVTTDVAVIWAMLIFSLSFQNLVPEMIRGLDDIKWASLLSGPVPQLLSLLFLGGFWLAQGTLTFELSTSLVAGAGMVASLVGIALLASRISSSPDRLRSYWTFLVDGTPIALGVLASYVLVQTDFWICGALLGKEQLAVYGMAQRLVVFVSMPLMVLGPVLTPTIASLLAKGEKTALRNIVSRATLVTATTASIVLILGAVVGRPAIELLFGGAYRDAYQLFLILGAGQAFHALAGPNGYILLMAGEQRVVMWSTLVATVLLAAGGWIAGQMWGATGIASTAAICLAIQTIWMGVAVRRRLGLVGHVHWRF